MPTRLEQLQAAQQQRIQANKGRPHVRNEDLYAGSPMHYYCRDCDEEMKLPESHRCPAPQYCGGCTQLQAELSKV